MSDDTPIPPLTSEQPTSEQEASPLDASGTPRPAGLWLRGIAKLADCMVAVLIAVTLLTALVALLHTAGLSGFWLFWFLATAYLLLPVLYFAHFNSAGRQTLGYRLAGIRVETVTHQPVGWWRSLGRAILNGLFQATTGLFIGFIDYLPLAFTRSKRALHDLLSGTQVVHVSAPRPALLLICAVAFPVLAFALRPFNFFLQAYYIPAGAMENTLHINDRVLVNELCYRLRAPQFQDVIVFRAPPASSVPPDTEFIKRCMGVPGDVVYAKNRHYYRNGRLVEEPYVKWRDDSHRSYSYDMKIVRGIVYSREYVAPEEPGLWSVNGVPIPEVEQKKIDKVAPERIPSDQFLMLGDYRNNSNDSHVWGLVPYDNLVGKAMLIYWPLQHLREL